MLSILGTVLKYTFIVAGTLIMSQLLFIKGRSISDHVRTLTAPIATIQVPVEQIRIERSSRKVELDVELDDSVELERFLQKGAKLKRIEKNQAAGSADH